MNKKYLNSLLVQKMHDDTAAILAEYDSAVIQQLGQTIFTLIEALKTREADSVGSCEEIEKAREEARKYRQIAQDRGLKIQNLCYPKQVDLDGNERAHRTQQNILSRNDS